MKYLFSIFLFIFVGYLLANTSNTIDCQTDSLDYTLFKSYFQDLVIGKPHDRGEKIPYNLFSKGLNNKYIDTDTEHEIYAIGKIIDYKGLDLYLIEDIEMRADEDSYDNHVDNYSYIMIFKDDKVLRDQNRDPIKYTLDYHYYGEGGENFHNSFFDKDTIIVTTEILSESESATGYPTPIVSNKKYRWQITPNGERELVDIQNINFSSDFYLQSFITENEQYWQDAESNRIFPQDDSRLWIDYKIPEFENEQITNIPFNVDFYFKKINGKTTVIFESKTTDNTIIESYTLGSNSIYEKTQKFNKKLKCPIIIKTSDGDIEILPNGKFVRK